MRNAVQMWGLRMVLYLILDMLARGSTAALTLTFRAGPLISGGTMPFLWFPSTIISVCHCLGPPGHDPGAGQHVVTAAQRHTQQLAGASHFFIYRHMPGTVSPLGHA